MVASETDAVNVFHLVLIMLKMVTINIAENGIVVGTNSGMTIDDGG